MTLEEARELYKAGRITDDQLQQADNILVDTLKLALVSLGPDIWFQPCEPVPVKILVPSTVFMALVKKLTMPNDDFTFPQKASVIGLALSELAFHGLATFALDYNAVNETAVEVMTAQKNLINAVTKPLDS